MRNTVDLHSSPRLQTRCLTFEWAGGGSLCWCFCCHAGRAKESGHAHCWDLYADSLSCLRGSQVTIGAPHEVGVWETKKEYERKKIGGNKKGSPI